MQNLIRLNLLPKEREKLKKQFQNLKTIDEQLDFWNEKLKIDFCYFDQYEMYDIQDFWIYPESENQFEYINTRNLSQFKKRLEPSQIKNAISGFEELKQQFLTKIETVLKKDFFINEELRKIDATISQKEIEVKQNPISKSRFLLATYKQYAENGIIQVWNKQINELGNLIESDKGLTLAKYKEFLEDYKSPKKPELKRSYSHAVQILILHYLGFQKELINKKKAKLYAPIINRDIETTRQMLSDLKELKTSKNLNLVLSYFTELDFSEQIQLVKKDIDRLKGKK